MSRTHIIHDYILYHIDWYNLEHIRLARHMVQIVCNILVQIWKQFGTDCYRFPPEKILNFVTSYFISKLNIFK